MANSVTRNVCLEFAMRGRPVLTRIDVLRHRGVVSLTFGARAVELAFRGTPHVTIRQIATFLPEAVTDTVLTTVEVVNMFCFNLLCFHMLRFESACPWGGPGSSCPPVVISVHKLSRLSRGSLTQSIMDEDD